MTPFWPTAHPLPALANDTSLRFWLVPEASVVQSLPPLMVAWMRPF